MGEHRLHFLMAAAAVAGCKSLSQPTPILLQVLIHVVPLDHKFRERRWCQQGCQDGPTEMGAVTRHLDDPSDPEAAQGQEAEPSRNALSPLCEPGAQT